MLRRLIGMIIGITLTSACFAETSSPSSQGGMQQMLLMLVVFIAIFYFLLIRPQSKRSKEQKQLMDGLSIGDEVTTAGGVLGRIIKIKDGYVVICVSKETEITFQKSSIAHVVPKGTIESING